MPRDFTYLSTETEQVLTDNTKRMAHSWNKTPRYVNQILNEERGDPFAPFKEMFDSAARAGLPTCHWTSSLLASEAANAPATSSAEPAECIKEKMVVNNKLVSKFVDAIADGALDEHEIAEMQTIVDEAARNIKKLQASLSNYRGQLQKQSKPKLRAA